MVGNTLNYFFSNVTGAIMYSESTAVDITLTNNFFLKYPELPSTLATYYPEAYIWEKVVAKEYFNTEMFYIKDTTTTIKSSGN